MTAVFIHWAISSSVPPAPPPPPPTASSTGSTSLTVEAVMTNSPSRVCRAPRGEGGEGGEQADSLVTAAWAACHLVRSAASQATHQHGRATSAQVRPVYSVLLRKFHNFAPPSPCLITSSYFRRLTLPATQQRWQIFFWEIMF